MSTAIHAKVTRVSPSRIRRTGWLSLIAYAATLLTAWLVPASRPFVHAGLAAIALSLWVWPRRRLGRCSLLIDSGAIAFDRRGGSTSVPFRDVRAWTFDGVAAKLYEPAWTWTVTPAAAARTRLRDALSSMLGAPAPVHRYGSAKARRICLAFCAASLITIALGALLNVGWLVVLGVGYSLVGFVILGALYQTVSPADLAP